jgi:GNAT superfamily N-acetyltransferase
VLLSEAAAVRVERVDQDYLRARVGGLAELAGNPDGAQLRDIGAASAFLVRALPRPVFNHVMGLTAATAEVLPRLAAWYARAGHPLRVDVTPAQASPELFAALRAAGAGQTGFYAGLFAPAARLPTDPLDPGPIEAAPVEAAPVEAAPVEVAAVEVDAFTPVYVEGFDVRPADRPTMARSVAVLAGRGEADFFAARIGGAVAGVGLLFRHAGVGYLASATTLPAYRGRGVQQALIRHRINAAIDAGCDLIAAQTAVGGASQRAMERAGLRLAYTKALWTSPAPA